jgi:hypothetical protein
MCWSYTVYKMCTAPIARKFLTQQIQKQRDTLYTVYVVIKTT